MVDITWGKEDQDRALDGRGRVGVQPGRNSPESDGGCEVRREGEEPCRNTWKGDRVNLADL